MLRGTCFKAAGRWYEECLKQGLAQGLVVPGATRGVPATALLHIRVESSTNELFERERADCQKFHVAVQKGLAGSGHLHLGDDDLTGLTDRMKSIWASSLGNAAVWRKTKYKVPVGRDANNKIGAFCQNPQTRARIFEAYYAGFGHEVDDAALQLLRTRRELAGRLGFATWADYELRPLAVGDAASAHRLMDQCWRDAQPTLTAYLRRMESLGAGATGAFSPQMAGRAPGAAGVAPGSSASSRIAHVDEAFCRALVTREADTWRLAEYFPANSCLPRLLDLVGRAYSVHFREVHKPETLSRLVNGWHKSVRVYEVIDGQGGAPLASASARRLGHVYLDLYGRTSFLGRPQVALAGALRLCPGHAYISMNFGEPGMGQNKLFNPEEMVAMAHELGHAIHMLCHMGSPHDWDDLPLDVKELPSTLAETIALQPGAVAQYARHYSKGEPPPEGLVRSCQRDLSFFVRYLQSAHVALGLHSEAFDPHSATPEELRRTAVELWQRYSPVAANHAFTPFGEEAGIYVAAGPTHIAYLLCYLRVDAILYGRKVGPPNSAASSARSGETIKKWLSPQFSSQVRAQLLDRDFPGSRLASLLPPLQG
eukprot:CAMPEP_0198588346 /NCGR_PEP_ID=MMETSP1462-20131121/133016_1 /TAXON_ID=1333877 /ORGANISM="Brandtodinium nutriculum, Strain RCC3387" /LENGTH=596 /DNA_ID=CAMNT_0044319845 /DNA_START=72 /DNA_END=1858 /DNA_ORIENTATION=-